MEAQVMGVNVDLAAPEAQEGVREFLRNAVLKVTFVKADGSDRVMTCTTAATLIPADKVPKGTGKPHTDNVQRVFDLDLQEWRSFIWSTVKEVEFCTPQVQ